MNHPLKVDGTSVHLLGHGYAPEVTVRDGKGEVAFSGPAPFLPQDGNFSSFGVIKAPDARPEQLGFEGFFLPTAVIDERGPISVFPDAVNPVLAMTAYYGRPAVETGKPQSVYQLDKSKLTQFGDGKGDKLRFQLAPGQNHTLPDGRGSITFDSYEPLGEAAGQPHARTQPRAGGDLAGHSRADGLAVHPPAAYLGAGPDPGRAYRGRGRRTGPGTRAWPRGRDPGHR